MTGKNQSRHQAIVALQKRVDSVERLAVQTSREHRKLAKASAETAKLMGTDSERILYLESGYHKLKMLVVVNERRVAFLRRPWWRKLLRLDPVDDALFKLVPIVRPEDIPKDGEELVPTSADLPPEPERGHHVLDIQSGKIGHGSKLVGVAEPPPEEETN